MTKKKPTLDDLPQFARFTVENFKKARPDVLTVMLTIRFENGNAGYKLIGFVVGDDGEDTDTMVFERYFGELT